MANEVFYESLFSSFWRDVRVEEFVEDEHSMFADEAVFDWLIDTIRPLEIIEVGSWKGHSANYMVDRCKSIGLASARCVCVDSFLGGPEHWLMPGAVETLHRKNGRPTILERFLGNTLKRGNQGRLFPLTLDSFGASEVLRYHNFQADLIFVDGAHDPDSVKRDILGFYPLLCESGVMFGDDYQYQPLAETVHACARALGVEVLVSSRKWIFANEALIRRVTLPNIQVRKSFDGWQHP